MMGSAGGALEDELRDQTGAIVSRWTISTTDLFLDFLWDSGMEIEEVNGLDRPVVVDSLSGPRRIVVQRVRGELRYWLATARDPMVLSMTGEDELGVVASVADLVSLCSEFLDSELRIADLTTRRTIGSARR